MTTSPFGPTVKPSSGRPDPGATISGVVAPRGALTKETNSTSVPFDRVNNPVRSRKKQRDAVKTHLDAVSELPQPCTDKGFAYWTYWQEVYLTPEEAKAVQRELIGLSRRLLGAKAAEGRRYLIRTGITPS